MGVLLLLVVALVTVGILVACLLIQEHTTRQLQKALEITQRASNRAQAATAITRAELLHAETTAKVITVWRAKQKETSR